MGEHHDVNYGPRHRTLRWHDHAVGRELYTGMTRGVGTSGADASESEPRIVVEVQLTK
jgi:hypothetical protein